MDFLTNVRIFFYVEFERVIWRIVLQGLLLKAILIIVFFFNIYGRCYICLIMRFIIIQCDCFVFLCFNYLFLVLLYPVRSNSTFVCCNFFFCFCVLFVFFTLVRFLQLLVYVDVGGNVCFFVCFLFSVFCFLLDCSAIMSLR